MDQGVWPPFYNFPWSQLFLQEEEEVEEEEEEEEVEVGEEGKNSQDTLHVYRLEEFIKKVDLTLHCLADLRKM